jgi:hypothetical protein
MRINLSKTDRVVISSRYGGLGDNLQFSTLPRRLKELGKSVYVKSSSYYRNSEIRSLVWESNPFIDGFIDEEPSAGDDCLSYRYYGLHENHIHNVEWSHGLEPLSNVPEIYYVPKKIESLQDVVISDMSAVSLAADYERIQSDIKRKIVEIAGGRKVLGVKYNNTLLATPAEQERPRFYEPPTSMFVSSAEENVEVSSIFDLADILYSCSSVCCLHSGAEALSLAVRRDGTNLHVFISSREHKKMKLSKLFHHPKVDYYPIGSL